MKKIYIILLCAMLFSSCSVIKPQATVTAVPTLTNTPTEIPSTTPTVPTSTFTSTPTLLVIPQSETPTLEFTFTPFAVTPLFLITPNTSTPTPQMKGFLRVTVSETEFYKGSKCQPGSVKFTAQVSDIGNTAYVVLFVRLKGKYTGNISAWTSIKMDTIGAGTYVHNLTSEEIQDAPLYQNPWVQYQFVATKANTVLLGRTEIFSERLSLLECKPTPTPSLSPTPTVLKP